MSGLGEGDVVVGMTVEQGGYVELQRQFLVLRRAGALPL